MTHGGSTAGSSVERGLSMQSDRIDVPECGQEVARPGSGEWTRANQSGRERVDETAQRSDRSRRRVETCPGWVGPRRCEALRRRLIMANESSWPVDDDRRVDIPARSGSAPVTERQWIRPESSCLASRGVSHHEPPRMFALIRLPVGAGAIGWERSGTLLHGTRPCEPRAVQGQRRMFDDRSMAMSCGLEGPSSEGASPRGAETHIVGVEGAVRSSARSCDTIVHVASYSLSRPTLCYASWAQEHTYRSRVRDIERAVYSQNNGAVQHRVTPVP